MRSSEPGCEVYLICRWQGLAACLALIHEANHRRVEEQMRRQLELEAYLLQRQVDLEQLRRQARDLGIDADQVLAGGARLPRHAARGPPLGDRRSVASPGRMGQ
ncbi:MAG: hypothetical protein ACRDO2_00520 [Nocardioidaceae bacterium]